MSMILRVWRGRTTPAKAVEYERVLTETHLPSIAARGIPGLRGISFGRRPVGDRVEVITVMSFDSMRAVVEYAGEDFERAAISEKARPLLEAPDEFVAHYEVPDGAAFDLTPP